jgi:hypothetical protein
MMVDASLLRVQTEANLAEAHARLSVTLVQLRALLDALHAVGTTAYPLVAMGADVVDLDGLNIGDDDMDDFMNEEAMDMTDESFDTV